MRRLNECRSGRRAFLLLVAWLCIGHLTVCAQNAKSGYQFLNVPVGAHSAALGGANISIVEDDASMMWTNAAMLTNVSDNSLMLAYNSYIHSSSILSAGYVKTVGERGTWALGVSMLNYGDMDETDGQGNVVGAFSAKDMNFQTSYSYLLSDYWSGAVTAKVVLSNYAEYSSTAIAADLSLNYFDAERGFSFSAVGRNCGGQIKSLYDDGEKESMPFALVLGLSKDFANAPLRVSLTADDLTHWDNVSFVQHFILGADILPSRNTWVALGYNFRRAHEMKVADKSRWAGFSIGAGLNVKKLKVGVAYAKYHVAASSLLINTSISF